MTLLISIVAFIALITGLILIHEAGHFFAARKSGVVVEEFGFGLPPRAKTLFTWRGTIFSLNWIPFGGFVRLKGENGIDSTDEFYDGVHAQLRERMGDAAFNALSADQRDDHILRVLAGETVHLGEGKTLSIQEPMFEEYRAAALHPSYIAMVRKEAKGGNARAILARGAFTDASIAARTVILLAGVAMNFLLAFVIFVFGFSAGKWIPTYLTLDEMEQAAVQGEISMKLGVYVEEVTAGGGAAKAGIPAGSIITKVDGLPISKPEDLIAYQENLISEEEQAMVQYTYLTGNEQTEERVMDVAVTDGKTGIALRAVPRELSAPLRNPLTAAGLALRETKVVTVQTVIGIAKLFTSLAQTGRVPEGVTGIVGIAQLTYTSVQEGFMVYLRLVALLSLSLAVLNVLPFPALDGGRLLFVLKEGIFRSKDRRLERVVTSVGFIVLILVMVLVTFSDVLRLFR